MDSLDYPWRKKKALTFSVNSTHLIRTPFKYKRFLWPPKCLYWQGLTESTKLLSSWFFLTKLVFVLFKTDPSCEDSTCNQPYQASLNWHYWYPQYGLPPQSAQPEVAWSCSSQEWWTHPQGSFIQTIDNRSQESQAPCPAVHGRLQMRPQSMRNNWSKQLGRSCKWSCPLEMDSERRNQESRHEM